MFHWSRLGGSSREVPIPMRKRSLRAAASHSHLPGDRGATGTRPESEELDRDFNI